MQLPTVSRDPVLPGAAAGPVNLNFLLRRQHHDHLAAFELGELLDYGQLAQIGFDALLLRHADFLVGHFAAAEAQGNLGLVAFFQEADHIAQFDLVVVFVRTRAEFDFLDLNLLLLELGGMQFLGVLILELAIIHQPANRGLRGGRNFNQIHLGFFSLTQGLIQAHNAKLFTLHTLQSNFARGDLTIDPRLFFLGSYRNSPSQSKQKPCVCRRLASSQFGLQSLNER